MSCAVKWPHIRFLTALPPAQLVYSTVYAIFPTAAKIIAPHPAGFKPHLRPHCASRTAFFRTRILHRRNKLPAQNHCALSAHLHSRASGTVVPALIPAHLHRPFTHPVACGPPAQFHAPPQTSIPPACVLSRIPHNCSSTCICAVIPPVWPDASRTAIPPFFYTPTHTAQPEPRRPSRASFICVITSRAVIPTPAPPMPRLTRHIQKYTAPRRIYTTLFYTRHIAHSYTVLLYAPIHTAHPELPHPFCAVSTPYVPTHPAHPPPHFPIIPAGTPRPYCITSPAVIPAPSRHCTVLTYTPAHTAQSKLRHPSCAVSPRTPTHPPYPAQLLQYRPIIPAPPRPHHPTSPQLFRHRPSQIILPLYITRYILRSRNTPPAHLSLPFICPPPPAHLLRHFLIVPGTATAAPHHIPHSCPGARPSQFFYIPRYILRS